DDPVVAMKGMFYRTNVIEVEQYKRNFSEAYNWTESTDSAIDEATKALQRVRDLAVQVSNDTYDEEQLKSVAEEINQLKEHIKTIANTKVGDKYIFNGTNTLNPPFANMDDAEPTFDTNDVRFELAKGIHVEVNMKGETVFGSGENSVFAILDRLETALQTDGDEGITDFIDEIDVGLQQFLTARSEIGARMN